jgi:hypothetical protein
MCSTCCQIGTWWHIPGCSQSLGHSWPETKCPDLGDWSELPPEDVLDRWESSIYWLSIYACEIAEKRLIELDRERLLAYNND